MTKYFLFLVVAFFLFIPHTMADCSLNEENRLKALASQVKVTYEYNDSYYDDYGEKVKEMFLITISGLTQEIYAVIEETSTYFIYDSNNNFITKDGFSSGTKTIKIYSKDSNCSSVLRKIYLTIPKYNYYADDPLCEGVDTTKFALCDKWYQFDIDYNTFVKRVNEYKKNEANEENQKPLPETPNNENKFLAFLNKYIVYIVSFLLLLITTIVIVIYRKRSDPFE